METNQFFLQLSPSAILLVSIFIFHFYSNLVHGYQLSGETFHYSERTHTHTHTHTHQNVRCHNLQYHNIKFVATGIWNFTYYCLFSCRWTSCVECAGNQLLGSILGPSHAKDARWVGAMAIVCRSMELLTFFGCSDTVRTNMSKVRPSDDGWRVMGCDTVRSGKDSWCFGGIYCFHFQSSHIPDYTKTHISHGTTIVLVHWHTFLPETPGTGPILIWPKLNP